MRKSYTCIILSSIISVSGLKAQFNDSTFYHTSYSTTGIINKTNDVSSYVLTNAFRFNVSRNDVRLNANASWIYGSQQSRLTNNDFTSSLDFNLYKTLPHFYYWGLATYDKSFSLKIVERYQAGLGAAYNVFDKPDFALNISDGVLYENSNLKINDSTNNRYRVFRNSFRLRYRLVVKEVIVLNGTNLLQNALNANNDYIVNSVNSLSFKLRRWLSLTASSTYNRIQRTNRENLLLTFGFTAEKYF
ncbi:DUF481 domain-containing protein [Segetibacter sp. 3557_3]|nr:DUF481 domain-containing protein [Segetibacter sp. 3557_3]